MKRRFFSLIPAALLLLSMRTMAWADYIHGHFRYTVADHSVTITAYYGEESEVTVPAMIGGNPVNTIASGAFSDAGAVQTIYLPDTIMSVEEEAFAVGQAVVYAQPEGASSNGEDEQGQGQQQSRQESHQETPAPSDSVEPEMPVDTPAAPSTAPVGISVGDGSFITTDDEHHLIQVNTDGSEMVIDDTQTYTDTRDTDGETVIRNSNNEPVVVSDGAVTYANSSGQKVTVRTIHNTTGRTTTTIIRDENGEVVAEEADIPAVDEETPATSQDGHPDASTPEQEPQSDASASDTTQEPQSDASTAPDTTQEPQPDASTAPDTTQEPQSDASTAPDTTQEGKSGALWLAAPILLAVLAAGVFFWRRHHRGA